MAIRNPFKPADLEGLPAELRGLLEDMRKERSAFEAGMVRSEEISREAEVLATSVAKAQKAVEQLGPQMGLVEGVSERLRSVQSDVEALTAGARDGRERVEETALLVGEARSNVDAIRPQLDAVIGLREDLAGILERAAPVRELDGLLRGLMARADEVKGRQDEIGTGVADASSRLAEVQGRFERIAGSVDALSTKAEAFAQHAAELRQLSADAPTLKRELGALRAMAEFVSAKTAALEGQRDAVERATRRAEELTELMASVDRQVAEQQTNARFLSQLEDRVNELKRLHESLTEQTEEIRRRQREIETMAHEQRGVFDSARSEVQDALAGFAFERDGLAAMHQRVEELREAMGSVQQRLPALDTATAGLANAEAAAQRLGERVAALTEQMSQVEATAAALAPLREEIGRAESQARELVQRVETAKRPSIAALDETERRVAELTEAVQSLERRAAQVEGYRVGLAEMAREINSRQGALDRAIAQLDQAVGLRGETAELAGKLEREAEALRSRLTEAGDAAARAEGQLAEFEERSRRLADVGARLGAFERRFSALLEAEEKIERSQALLDQRKAALDAVRDDLARLYGIADSTVEKVRGVAALQKEIDNKRQAMEEISERLRQLDGLGAGLEARGQQFAEAERHLQLLDAHLSDMKATLGTVLEQREFLEKAIEATGRLGFETVHAESVLAQLREAAGGEGGGGAGGARPSRSSTSSLRTP